MTGAQPEAGWYANPAGVGLRWWDGERWSDRVKEVGQAPLQAQPARSSGAKLSARVVLACSGAALLVIAGTFAIRGGGSASALDVEAARMCEQIVLYSRGQATGEEVNKAAAQLVDDGFTRHSTRWSLLGARVVEAFAPSASAPAAGSAAAAQPFLDGCSAVPRSARSAGDFKP